jgi:hypothetical protein
VVRDRRGPAAYDRSAALPTELRPGRRVRSCRRCPELAGGNPSADRAPGKTAVAWRIVEEGGREAGVGPRAASSPSAPARRKVRTGRVGRSPGKQARVRPPRRGASARSAPASVARASQAGQNRVGAGRALRRIGRTFWMTGAPSFQPTPPRAQQRNGATTSFALRSQGSPGRPSLPAPRQPSPDSPPSNESGTRGFRESLCGICARRSGYELV